MTCCARAGWDVEARRAARRAADRAWSSAPRRTSSIGRRCGCSGSGRRRRARRRRRPGPHARRRARRGARRARSGPTIVCAQAGNVNTGAFDPLGDIARSRTRHGAWLHVDGAFGLWAARRAAPRAHLAAASSAPIRGRPTRTSGSTCRTTAASCSSRDPARASRGDERRRAVVPIRAAGEQRDGMDWTPEVVAPRARRRRSTPRCARSAAPGVAELVERSCALARRMAERSPRAGRHDPQRRGAEPGAGALRLRTGPTCTPARDRARPGDGTCWAGGTDWNGEPAMRISVSNWRPPTRTSIVRRPRSCGAFDRLPEKTSGCRRCAWAVFRTV